MRREAASTAQADALTAKSSCAGGELCSLSCCLLWPAARSDDCRTCPPGPTCLLVHGRVGLHLARGPPAFGRHAACAHGVSGCHCSLDPNASGVHPKRCSAATACSLQGLPTTSNFDWVDIAFPQP